MNLSEYLRALRRHSTCPKHLRPHRRASHRKTCTGTTQIDICISESQPFDALSSRLCSNMLFVRAKQRSHDGKANMTVSLVQYPPPSSSRPATRTLILTRNTAISHTRPLPHLLGAATLRACPLTRVYRPVAAEATADTGLCDLLPLKTRPSPQTFLSNLTFSALGAVRTIDVPKITSVSRLSRYYVPECLNMCNSRSRYPP